MPRMTALRATKACGPARFQQRLTALRLAAVAIQKGLQAQAGLKLHLVLFHDTSCVSSDGCSLYPRRIKGCDRWGIRNLFDAI